jgi:predicted secreted protein
MIGAVFAVAILLAETAPAAGTPAAPAAAAPTAASEQKADRDTKVCHNEEILGSRIPKRVCYSQEESEARSQQDRRTVERMQSQMSYTSH